MGSEGIFGAIYYLLFGGIIGYNLNDQIGMLPGQPVVNFRQFSGYINIDSNATRSLFYYFVEAEEDPLDKPLTIWLSGGPGCSSVGDSFFGVGPFIITSNAHGLKRNPYAWNKVSNMLFIDSPVGTGWSYSNTKRDYQVGDSSTNSDLVIFLLKWFEKYPIFKYRDLFLGGTSYAGHFVPNFAKTLLQHNNQSKIYNFNLKGIVLGNPVLRLKLDILAEHELYVSKGMIPKKLYKLILKQCFEIDENNYSDNVAPWSQSCQRPMRKSLMIAFNVTSVQEAKQRQFDFRRTPCDGKIEDLISGKEVTKITDEVDMCIPFRTNFYFNIPEVQKVFRGNRTNSRYPWMSCFPGLNYNLFDKDTDMLPTLKQILLHSVSITIFSGDEDGAIPMIGTLKHVKMLAKDMNLNLTKNEAWHDREKKEGGWLYSYEDLLTFMTVKGANHHVPFSKPSQALFIFRKHVFYAITRLLNEAHN
ncbi:serine carboxypeptidase-like 44 [Hibiscus trionum]|uniref:Serine carboxypeptidase-like 44 n=1 Tax=Hibiscus trionum TaxID=183268 RepID=A0A9W7J1N5_HIBTR|nr:serine carboxypeptidase-like 44 [Hibiscus trionum]